MLTFERSLLSTLALGLLGLQAADAQTTSTAGAANDDGANAAKGAVIRDPPQNFEWAYEFQVEDPNAHVLRFGSEPKPNMPRGKFRT